MRYNAASQCYRKIGFNIALPIARIIGNSVSPREVLKLSEKTCWGKTSRLRLGILILSLSLNLIMLGYYVSKREDSIIREGDLWIGHKVDEGCFWKVHGSGCGCCGSDFSSWLYVPKSFNLTIGCWYHVTVYKGLIIDFEEIR